MSRGQSETIGFVLVFSLIVASTGIVYVGGFSSLQDARNAEQTDNVERAFGVLDDNVQDMVRRGAPTRATEISLGGGGLRLTEPTNVTVTATNTTDPSDNVSVTVRTRPLVFRRGDREVVYTSGAVIRGDEENSIMVQEPEWLVDERRTVVPILVASAGDSRTAIGGQTTVLVRTGLNSRNVVSLRSGSASAVNLTVTVESARADAWKRFFEAQGLVAVDGNASDGDVTYRLEVQEAYVQLTAVSVGFDR